MTAPDYRRVKAGCLIALTAATIGLAFAVAGAVRNISEDTGAFAQSTAQDVHSLVLPIQKASAGVASAGLAVAQVGAKERDAFSSQQHYYGELTTHTNQVLGSADATLRTVNLVTLPAVSSMLADTGIGVSNVTGQMAETIRELSPGIQSFNRAGESLATDAAEASPVIVDLGTTVHETAATAADVHKIADYEYGQIVKPVKKIEVVAHVVIKGIGWFLGW